MRKFLIPPFADVFVNNLLLKRRRRRWIKMKNFWTFVGITIIAIVLALVIWSYANAINVKDYLNWTKVIVVQRNAVKTDVILANPKDEDVIFVIITIINGEDILFYTFVGDDIQTFANTPDGYIDMKISEERKKEIWVWLRKIIGLYKI